MRQPEGEGSAERGGPADNQGRVGDGAAPLPLTRGGGEAAATDQRRKSPPTRERSRRRVRSAGGGRGRTGHACAIASPVPPSAPVLSAPPPPRHGCPPVHTACSLAVFDVAGSAVAVHAALFLRPQHCRRRVIISADSVLCIVAATFVVLVVSVFSILDVAGAAVVVLAARPLVVLAAYAPSPPSPHAEQCWIQPLSLLFSSLPFRCWEGEVCGQSLS